MGPVLGWTVVSWRLTSFDTREFLVKMVIHVYSSVLNDKEVRAEIYCMYYEREPHRTWYLQLELDYDLLIHIYYTTKERLPAITFI